MDTLVLSAADAAMREATHTATGANANPATDVVAEAESGASLAVGGALATALARTPDLIHRSGALATEVAADCTVDASSFVVSSVETSSAVHVISASADRSFAQAGAQGETKPITAAAPARATAATRACARDSPLCVERGSRIVRSRASK